MTDINILSDGEVKHNSFSDRKVSFIGPMRPVHGEVVRFNLTNHVTADTDSVSASLVENDENVSRDQLPMVLTHSITLPTPLCANNGSNPYSNEMPSSPFLKRTNGSPHLEFRPSTYSLVDERIASLPQWSNSEEARASIVSLLSGLYALTLVMLAFTIEVSLIVSEATYSQYEPFYTYLYTAGLCFFGYCYVFLLRTRNLSNVFGSGFHKYFNEIVASRVSRTTTTDSARSQHSEEVRLRNRSNSFEQRIADSSNAMSKKRKVTYSSPSAGSMYLRLGAVFFGVVSMTHNCITIVNRVGTSCLYTLATMNLFLANTFIFVQLYFIFMNSKLTIHRFKNLGRFATMHLVATNLCVWIRSIILEEHHVMLAIEQSKMKVDLGRNITAAVIRSKHSISDASNDVVHHQPVLHHLRNDIPVAYYNIVDAIAHPSCMHHGPIQNFVKEMKPFMTICLIEYSILCAAIMFILWRNVGYKPVQHQKQRKQSLRVDCSSSSRGLFLGLVFLILTIVSMVIFFTKIHMDDDIAAMWVFYTTFSILYFVATTGCVLGMYKMRTLKYAPVTEQIVLLDDILLVVSLCGQLSYCLFSLLATNPGSNIGKMAVIFNILRMVQVFIQTIFLLAGQRLLALTIQSQAEKPGREIVTFLLVVNVSLWLINTFETEKATANSLMTDFYGKGPWTIIVQGAFPLCIFFRFHSSVCFAEIWKNVYRIKY